VDNSGESGPVDPRRRVRPAPAPARAPAPGPKEHGRAATATRPLSSEPLSSPGAASVAQAALPDDAAGVLFAAPDPDPVPEPDPAAAPLEDEDEDSDDEEDDDVEEVDEPDESLLAPLSAVDDSGFAPDRESVR
jgi:hypothetical protein